MMKPLIILYFFLTALMPTIVNSSDRFLVSKNDGNQNFTNEVKKYSAKAFTYKIYDDAVLCFVVISGKTKQSNGTKDLFCLNTYVDGRGNKSCYIRRVNMFNSMGLKKQYVGLDSCNKTNILNSIKNGNFGSILSLNKKGLKKIKRGVMIIIKDSLDMTKDIRKMLKL